MTDVNRVSRMAPVPYEDWDAEVLDALSVLAPGRKMPPSNVLGLFARHPDLARAFLTFNKHLFDSTLPARTRELAILRVAWRRRCRYEWAQHVLIAKRAGITVNAVPPGFIDTPMLRKAESRQLLGGTVEDHIERTPVRRIGTPQDIAAACSFLISEEAGYITGQILGVNGGRNT